MIFFLVITPRGDLRSSWLLQSADVSGQLICALIEVLTPLRMEAIDCPETSVTTNIHCVTSRKNKGLIYSAREAGNYA